MLSAFLRENPWRPSIRSALQPLQVGEPRSVCHLLRLCSDREHIGRRPASARSTVGFDKTISQRFMVALMTTFSTHKVGTDRHPGALGRQIELTRYSADRSFDHDQAFGFETKRSSPRRCERNLATSCPLTLLPALSRGGAKVPSPPFPGETVTMPPPIPLLPGRPMS